LVLGGCLTTRPVELPELQQLPPKQAVAVYRSGRGTLIDSVQVRGDTLTGRTLAKFPDGPRPLFALPLVEADSIRLAHPDANALKLFMLPIAVITGFVIYLNAVWGGD
jgi:hypothetical protein